MIFPMGWGKLSPVKMRIGGFVDLSTVDWYGHLTFMVFASGCPFRCAYCQNAGLIPLDSGNEVDLGTIKQRIKGNLGLLDAVGLSGGEPSLQSEAVTTLFRWAKKQGLKTFMNTNGINPDLIKKLINEKLIDHVAISVVAPLRLKDYRNVMGLPRSAEKAVESVKESIRICLDSKIQLEIRTTIVPGLIDDEQSIREIARAVKGCKFYVLQQYSPVGDILNPKFKKVNPPKRELLIKLAKAASEEGIRDVRIRTREYGEERVTT